MPALIFAYGCAMFVMGAWLSEPWWKFGAVFAVALVFAVATTAYHYYLVDKAMQRCGGD